MKANKFLVFVTNHIIHFLRCQPRSHNSRSKSSVENKVVVKNQATKLKNEYWEVMIFKQQSEGIG
jgi:aspartate carbamoyltransferase regulatory subunit